MSLLALIATHAAATGDIPVTASGPTWVDDQDSGGGTWTTPTQTGITYSPASGTATPGQAVTVTATAQPGYVLQGAASWSHTFPSAPGVGLPYAIPTAFPYNAPVYSDLPTPDGTGSATHPSAWDFGPSGWRGWRFWMANTPYYNQDILQENPCVWVSQDGYHWEVPAGGRNPIYPTPGGGLWYSDTDIHYDAANDELLLIWRGPGERINIVGSSDGITWPATIQDVTPSHEEQGGLFLAPSLVQIPDGTWRLYGSGQGWGFYSSVSYTHLRAHET